MQINFPTQSTEYNLKPVSAAGETKKIQSKPEKDAVETKQPEPEKLEHLQSALSEHDLNLKFTQDADTKQLVVELVDSKTGEAIRQMPSEVSLKFSATFAKLQGQLVDQHA